MTEKTFLTQAACYRIDVVNLVNESRRWEFAGCLEDARNALLEAQSSLYMLIGLYELELQGLTK